MRHNEQEFLEALPAPSAPVSEILAWGPMQFLGTRSVSHSPSAMFLKNSLVRVCPKAEVPKIAGHFWQLSINVHTQT